MDNEKSKGIKKTKIQTYVYTGTLCSYLTLIIYCYCTLRDVIVVMAMRVKQAWRAQVENVASRISVYAHSLRVRTHRVGSEVLLAFAGTALVRSELRLLR